jgi:hypothetical protein
MLVEEPAITKRNEAIKGATLHMKQAEVQCALANKKMQEAIDDAGKTHSERRQTFIADNCQNMELPYFGESQPGDTYYFSPLKNTVFGVVDCSLFG